MVDPASAPVQSHLDNLKRSLTDVYKGQSKSVSLLLTGFLAAGHILLEDIPGVGKTTLARALAKALGGTCTRIQCTPDLMPTDITGLTIYDERDKQFHLHKGPIFTDILIADELNRTPPRTQSALLEAMSENQVTIEGTCHPLNPLFLCIATQNPLDHAGTYPLPDSQRDRFLLRFALGYPDQQQERELLLSNGTQQALAQTTPCLSQRDALELRQQILTVTIEESVLSYLLAVIQSTRQAPGIAQGASTRAALGFKQACQAYAYISGRSYVIPQDIQDLAHPALGHRIVTRSNENAAELIASLLANIEVPR